MNILVIGNEANRVEITQKFGAQHVYQFVERLTESSPIQWAEIILDFISPTVPNTLIVYDKISTPIFLDTTLTSLTAIVKAAGLKRTVFGFCGLHTFVNRELMEVCIYNKSDEVALNEVCTKLNTRYSLVTDQVGFVTPRIICMIINEAYFTVAEGTATREDVDLAMKLGTNYPFGPFEWATRIGLKNIMAVLNAAKIATGDQRYNVCQLLKAEALSS